MFDQSPYACRVEWGMRGAREAAKRGDITIIVDVLSFSSTVVTAVHHGAVIYPHPKNEQARDYAQQVQAQLILGRAESVKLGTPTLSPVTFAPQHRGQKFVLCSLNGAACSWIAAQVPALLVGCLLNAQSVASIANQLRVETGANITVIPCGEQWDDMQDDDQRLRPSIEDYLGAGAILNYLTGEKSPEAEVCLGAFHHSQYIMKQLIWDCGSSRELRQRNLSDDVHHCSQFNIFQAVPRLRGDHFYDVSMI